MADDGSSFLPAASSILNDPDVKAAQAREAARLGMHLADVGRSSGVCISGMGPEAFQSRPIEALISEAEAMRKRGEAFAASPRGRFLTALSGLEEIGYFAEADRARSSFYRGFSDERQPASIGEIAVALAALNDVPGSDARTARGCLSELLLAVHARRAA